MSEQIDYSQFILKAAEKYRQAGMFNRYGILKDAADQFKFMVEQIDKINTEMPCGHLARYAVNGEEGTQYCSMCEKEHWQKLGEIKALQELCNEIDASVYPETWGYIFQKMEDLKGYQS